MNKERGYLDQAAEFHRRALAIREQLVPESLAQAGSLNTLGLVIRAQGDLDRAEEIHHRRPGKPDLAVFRRHGKRAKEAETQNLLGGCPAGLGRFDEAEPLLLEGYEALRTATRQEGRVRRQARNRIIAAYEAQGRPDDADRYRLRRQE